jgi:hypothetical protein
MTARCRRRSIGVRGELPIRRCVICEHVRPVHTRTDKLTCSEEFRKEKRPAKGCKSKAAKNAIPLPGPSDRNGETQLARKTILVSDLSGKEINDKDAAKVTISYSDARRGLIVLDVNASEVSDLAAKGTQQKRRGRKPKTSA